ncbi:acetyl-CoA hydrolase/transferase family protein [Geomicrobium sp. JCM 19038]|uniref:acetyl-CoA hydrolase/transferase family protein n=1 Tax=Geomicrobium sp. JCM 19038 TaxID=1460635 RepID=UPI00045F43AB|nr:acetyl-CoA hydrolase/transferase C-terminal domain-containing protein [Geomicrobium sp. JCM 19038]GAK07970.1 4-hydroxybutyrate coenzyme A transferase [Geomicrobium sp. JCM 19038]
MISYTPIDQAIAQIPKIGTVVLPGLSGEPLHLLDALVSERARFTGLTIYHMPLATPCHYANPLYKKHFQIRSFLLNGQVREAVKQNMAEYVPMNLSNVPGYMDDLQPDVAFIMCTEPNAEGHVSLGVSCDYTLAALRVADVVIAEVNPSLPWTDGETVISTDEINYFVKGEGQLNELSAATPGELEQQIAAHVATLVPDTATIQVGIGSLANAVVASLHDKRELGVHTGTFPEAMIQLINDGVVTNEHKEVDQGKVVATCLVGSKELYAFADRNPQISLQPSNYTHHTATIAKLSNFIAINSAIEVDLVGNINAEMINETFVAGVGGQMDFMRGAMASRGGKSIIALPSTASRGKRSRIVMNVQGFTSTKSDVHYVVTEYGIASLFGKSTSERAEALIDIAHPDFREALRQEFYEQVGQHEPKSV